MPEVRHLSLDGLLELRPRRIADERGFFSEVWNAAEWRDAGIDLAFVQDNHSLSRSSGVLRGMHYQIEPFAQDKLVRVSRGSVYDVAVDIRRGSPTFGRWVGLTLSAELWNQIWVPKGFAHGFVTLEPNTEVQYKVTAPYDPACDRGISYDDPAIGVEWPIEPTMVQLSGKDRILPLLADADTGFTYE